MLCILFYNFFHVILFANLSLTTDFNVNECLIADLKKKECSSQVRRYIHIHILKELH